MNEFMFENLHVYQKSIQFADDITNITEKFPKGKFYISDQLNRAVTSIPFNIAEGNGKFTAGDKRSYFRIARGSAFECVAILDICSRKKLIHEIEHKQYRETLVAICKMLTGLINKNS
ncbi:MAG: four helix bundle protein [Candidatus Goldbacteria bacterium]|nr:four helix bundle protein [Candidatus Goldiibacteriota bacterium]